MKSNRFDFLELNDEAATLSPEAADIDAEPDPLRTPPVHPVRANPEIELSIPGKTPVKRTQPPRLAEVRVDQESSRIYTLDETASNQWVQNRTLKAVEVFGNRGDKAGEFNFPTGIAIDKSGVLWVADSYNNRLQRITPDGGVAIVGTRGLNRGQFMMPMAVAVDDERSFYVVEQGSHRMQKFSSEGVLQFTVGRSGSRPGELRAPMGIAVNPDTHEILIADTGNSRVQRFDREGRFVGMIGLAEPGHQTLINPQAIACDIEGRIYVADTFERRILQYDPVGRLLGYYGGQIGPGQRAGSALLQLDEPRSLACSPIGRLFVADAQRGAGAICVVDIATGSNEANMTSPGRKLGALARPCGIAIAPVTMEGISTGDVYLADTMNHRIIRFAWT